MANSETPIGIVIDYKIIGKQISRIRKSQNISQFELSALVDMSPSFISYVETGKRALSIHTLLLISHHLNTTPDHILKDYITSKKSDIDSKIEILLLSCTLKEKQAVYDISSLMLQIMRRNEH